MSGLCGVLFFDGRPAQPAPLPPMIAAAAHRGPDGVHTWSDRRAHLGHLALHVTPEDTREQQPLVDDHGLALVADARLDNRAALRRTLHAELRGPAPTDADLLLAAYRRWGPACARHLIGDFAFAVWDAREQRLFAARDPMAMRALYYRAEPGRFLFATEVKQLLAAPGVPARLYRPMVAAYLAGNFNDLTNTFYEGIQALPPAHALLATRDGTRTWRYWAPDPTARLEYDDDRDYVAHFRHLFAEAVRARLRSVHPVGLFLSGGLDSGSVASMAGHLQDQNGEALAPLRTYSWAFSAFPECDERFISDHIVDRYGFAATAVDAEAPPLLRRRPYVGPDRDAPYVTGFHGLAEHALQRARADGVRCMLSGHRGDLVVGGWLFDYLRFLRTGQWGRLWRDLRLAEQNTGVPRQRAAQIYLTNPLRAALWPSGTAEWLRAPLKAAYRTLRPASPPSSPFPDWIRPEFAARHDALPPPYAPPDALRDPMRRRRYEMLLLPAHMRVAALTERNGARHGLAAADPWSDRRLVEFAAAVPPAALCQLGENKWIAREAMRGIMPEAARSSAQKINPHPLYEHALKVRLRSLVDDILLADCSPAFHGNLPVDVDQLGAYYHTYRDGAPEDPRFWYTLTLGLWLRRHHDANPHPSRSKTTHEERI